MLKKWLYIIGWTAALFVATLPTLFKGELAFSLKDKTVGEMCTVYMFPVFMAFALLVADVLYQAEHDKVSYGRVKNTSTLIICVLSFLFSFAFSVWLETPWACWLCFSIAWFSMAVLKFSKTEAIGSAAYLDGNVVPD